MITLKELNPHDYDVLDDVASNLQDLLYRINKIRSLYNKPMIITSGLRSIEDQERINPSAMHSKHLTGQACDVEDKDGKLRDWLLANMKWAETYSLWFEDFGHTKGWVHFQCCPPKSGKRVFIP